MTAALSISMVPMAEQRADIFNTTRWTLVLAAGGSDAKAKETALAALCTTYWNPIFIYIRRRGYDAEQAKDLTQEFFGRLLEKDWLAGLSREGSKFRAFLLVAVRRFLAVEYEHRTAIKRGGGAPPLALDGKELPEPASQDETPEVAFDRTWALTVIERALERVRAESKASGKDALFAQVAGFLAADPEPGAYDAVAHNLGISRSAVAMAVHRLRLRLREQVRAEVAETLSNHSQIEGEMQELLAALRR